MNSHISIGNFFKSLSRINIYERRAKNKFPLTEKYYPTSKCEKDREDGSEIILCEQFFQFISTSNVNIVHSKNNQIKEPNSKWKSNSIVNLLLLFSKLKRRIPFLIVNDNFSFIPLFLIYFGL